MSGVQVIGSFGNMAIAVIFLLLIAILFFFGICCGGFGIKILFSTNEEDEKIVATLLIICAILSIPSFLYCVDKARYYDTSNNQNQRIIVNDKVNINEFIKRYDIIEVDGKTLLVKDKKKMEE